MKIDEQREGLVVNIENPTHDVPVCAIKKSEAKKAPGRELEYSCDHVITACGPEGRSLRVKTSHIVERAEELRSKSDDKKKKWGQHDDGACSCVDGQE